MVGKNTRRSFHLLVGATLTIATSIIGSFLTSSLTGEQSWWSRLAWLAAGIAVTFFYLRWQLRSQEESPEAIKERVNQLASELRSQVQSRSYGARRQLIEAPLRELDLDITPRVGWVRDPRLLEPKPISEQIADPIVAAFESSKRRLLIVGEPGSGKTMAAYSLIEHLDEREGDQRIPLLVNLSAWEAQETFEAFLVDYLCSPVGYQVRGRTVANAFIGSGRYALILDGLDEIPAGLRQHFSERLDEFVRGLPGEVGVVVTCRTQEYEQLLAAHRTGLGLVQAVEILPLTSEQLDSAFVELAKLDKDWEAFLSQRDLTAYQRVRRFLSNPLFLNLAVVGRLSPSQLLDWTTTEQELRDLVLDSYVDRTLADQRQADQRQYESEAARRYLTWIARFLNGTEFSPFNLKISDPTVFDLANLTPPDPPRRYRLFAALVVGLEFGLIYRLGMGVLGNWSATTSYAWIGLVFGLVVGLVGGFPYKRSAVSSRLTLVWPSTRQQLRAFLSRTGLGLIIGTYLGLLVGMGVALFLGLLVVWPILGLYRALTFVPTFGPAWALGLGPSLGLVWGLVSGLVEPRSVLITYRTPKEANSRSLITALIWSVLGLTGGLVGGLGMYLAFRLVWEVRGGLGADLVLGLVLGLNLGLIRGLENGGWFVLLQKIAHRRLARAGDLPPRPYDFLEWGIEMQIFRRVGGGVRFRHNLIQQHLASTSPKRWIVERARASLRKEPGHF